MKSDTIQETIKSAILEINKGNFEEITELEEEHNYSSGFNSQRSGDRFIGESKYFQMKQSQIEEENVLKDKVNQNDLSSQELDNNEDLKMIVCSEIINDSPNKNNETNNFEESSDIDLVVSDPKNFELFQEDQSSKKRKIGNEITQEFLLKEKNEISDQESFDRAHNENINHQFKKVESQHSIYSSEKLIQKSVNEDDSNEIDNDYILSQRNGDEANPNTPLINKGIISKNKLIETEIFKMNEQTKNILMKEKELSSFFEDSEVTNKIQNKEIISKNIISLSQNEEDNKIENISQLEESAENESKEITQDLNQNENEKYQFSWKNIKQ